MCFTGCKGSNFYVGSVGLLSFTPLVSPLLGLIYFPEQEEESESKTRSDAAVLCLNNVLLSSVCELFPTKYLYQEVYSKINKNIVKLNQSHMWTWWIKIKSVHVFHVHLSDYLMSPSIQLQMMNEVFSREYLRIVWDTNTELTGLWRHETVYWFCSVKICWTLESPRKRRPACYRGVVGEVCFRGGAAGVAGRPELHTVRTTDRVKGLLRAPTAGAARRRVTAGNTQIQHDARRVNR